jgi:hypothetical protein
MELAAALREWGDFYLLVGTAGAALVALLFVAVSIGVGLLTRARAAAVRTYMSPVVVHFAAVIFISAVAMAPVHPALLVPIVIGAAAVVGAGVGVYTTVRVAKDEGGDIVYFDRFAYGALPALAYVAIFVAAAVNRWAYAPELLAGGLLLLLLVNIRNAWDLMLTLVRRHEGTG